MSGWFWVYRTLATQLQRLESSANLYGLIETAKANGIEPYAYLKMIFTELPQATSLEEFEALLPIKKCTEESKAA